MSAITLAHLLIKPIWNLFEFELAFWTLVVWLENNRGLKMRLFFLFSRSISCFNLIVIKFYKARDRLKFSYFFAFNKNRFEFFYSYLGFINSVLPARLITRSNTVAHCSALSKMQSPNFWGRFDKSVNYDYFFLIFIVLIFNYKLKSNYLSIIDDPLSINIQYRSMIIVAIKG